MLLTEFMNTDILYILIGGDMANRTIPRQIRLTEGQDNVLSALLSKTGESYAEFTRRLISREAAENSLIFPQDTPSNDISKAREKRWKK